MSKMHYFSNKFSSFNIGDLKFRDLAKLCFFKLIMTKSNFKNSNDVISATLSPLHHRKTSQFFQSLNQNFWLRQTMSYFVVELPRKIKLTNKTY